MDEPPVQKKPSRDLHPVLFAFTCGGVSLASWHALGPADYGPCRKPVGYLGHLDPSLPALLGTGHEDDETVDLRDAVAAPADLGNGHIVFLSYFNWLWLERPEAAASTAASSEAPSSETRSFTS